MDFLPLNIIIKRCYAVTGSNGAAVMYASFDALAGAILLPELLDHKDEAGFSRDKT